MNKNLKLFLEFLPIIVIAVLVYTYIFHFKTQKVILPNGQVIYADVADNVYKQTRGLMYRKFLRRDSGMLFVFDSTLKHVFWMKNTKIPLDIIWLDENLKIVGLKENARPCENKKGAPCQTYMPSLPAKYVLELNAGKASENDLVIGSQLKLAE